MAKGNDELSPNEALAARVMLSVYGEGWVVDPKDIKGAPPSTHDFNLVSDVSTVAVEISTIADTITMGHPMRWDRSFPGGMIIVDGLANGWIVTARTGGDPRRLRRQIEECLLTLEALGIRSTEIVHWQRYAFESESLRPPEFDVLRQLQAVGVQIVSQVDELPPGTISLMLVDDGYVWNVADDERFSEFISDELQGTHASDVAKVVKASADRRAVFLWLHAGSHFDMTRRLNHGLLAGTVFGAEEIDEVWIGRQMIDGQVLVYRWTETDGWVTYVNNDGVATHHDTAVDGSITE